MNRSLVALVLALMGTGCCSFAFRYRGPFIAPLPEPIDLLDMADETKMDPGHKFKTIKLGLVSDGAQVSSPVVSIHQGQSDHLELVLEQEMHYHRYHDRLITVLRGDLDLVVHEGGVDQLIELEEGDVALIPRLVPHQLKTSGSDPTPCLTVYSPTYDAADFFLGRGTE